jgi:hypothetical protein
MKELVKVIFIFNSGVQAIHILENDVALNLVKKHGSIRQFDLPSSHAMSDYQGNGIYLDMLQVACINIKQYNEAVEVQNNRSIL